jgi:EAL domain-containing protein (putative c-di-GMP-specific phosphodiesterase class I)
MGSHREAKYVTASHAVASQDSGVHQSPTQPAPYIDDEAEEFRVGSIPMEALTAHFQPIVALRTGKTFGFAAIAHCDREDLSNLEELYARASFEKKVGELGRAVRLAAFAQCPATPVFVSVHPHELKEAWLIRPDDPLCSHDAEVFLQVNQQTYSPMCAHILTEVCSRSGVGLVLDDFGNGASNLRQLIELSPAFVKLSEDLASGIDRSARKRVVVSGIVQICLDLGAQVIAKGIENDIEAKVLIECGVVYGEGNMIGAPGPRPRISHWRTR